MTGVIKSSDGAELVHSPARSGRSAVAAVLVLHGGSADSFVAAHWRDPAVLRLWPVARAIARELPGATVYRLRFSIRGWNGRGDAALRDARWALGRIRDFDPGLPIVVVGHSLGGRVAFRVGGDPDVAGVVGLTPWTPSDDPAAQLAGVPVVVIQAGRDRVIPERTTRPWLARAEHAGARDHPHRAALGRPHHGPAILGVAPARGSGSAHRAGGVGSGRWFGSDQRSGSDERSGSGQAPDSSDTAATVAWFRSTSVTYRGP